MLAENSTVRAYAEAALLKDSLPHDALPVDRARLLNLLARIEIYRALPEKADGYIQQALEIAKQNNDLIGQAEADLNIAINAINLARIDDVIEATVHGLAILDGLDRPDLLGEALLRMSMVYRRTGQFEESVTMALQALDIARQSNNPLALTYAYQGMAISYEQSNRLAEALENYKRMREQARSSGSRLLEGYALHGIAITTGSLGDLKSAERSIRETIQIYREIGVRFSICFGLFALAEIMNKQGQYAETLPIFDEIIEDYKRFPNKIGLWWVLNARSDNLMALGRIHAARQDTERAYDLAKEIGSPVYLTDSSRRLASIAAAKGQHRMAYMLLLEADDMAAKAAKETSAMRMLQLTKRYQTESKQREIDKLSRRNQQQALELAQRKLEQHWLWTLLGGSGMVLVGTGLFLVRLRRSNQGLARLNAQVLRAKNKLQATLDTIPDLLFELGLDGRYYDYHSPRTDLLVAPADALIGKTVKEVMPNEAADICLSALSEAYEKGASRGKQFELSLPEGTFWFELSVAVKPTAPGDETRFIVLSRDITERKHYEAALLARAELERRQSQFFKIAPGYFYTLVQYAEKHFAMPFASDGLRDLYGLEPEEVTDDIQKMLALTHSDDIERFKREILNSSHLLKPFHLEFRIVHPEKGERWIEARSLPQREADGNTLWHGFMLDITERKLAEAEVYALNASLEQRVLERTDALRLQTRYLRTLIDTMPMFAWLKDTESRFLVVNQAFAEAVSQTVDSMVGQCDFDFWPDEHAKNYRADDAEVMVSRRLKTVEEPFVCARGALLIETFKAPVLDEDGSVLGTVGIARDISERKAMEQAREKALAEAERLARLRSEFMARMSHELRTPLNSILGYAQLLLGENRLNERQSFMLNVMQQSGEYLLHLINDILDFSKIEAGKQTLNLGDVHLPGFLRNLIGIVGVKAALNRLAVVCDVAKNVPVGLYADEMRLRQVLLNLLSNAIKFSEQGQVYLRVSLLDSGLLRFEVQDKGIGIDPVQLETIFQPFEQAGGGRQGGTGLGLAISRELVRLMGGELYVSSRVGEGSTFWFDLKLPFIDVCGEVMPIEQEILGYRGPRLRILVADDVDENRALLINMLKHLGFETMEAVDGESCLERAKSGLPDLILLDMIMPEMGGLETARHLRQWPDFRRTPVIAVSARVSGADVADALDAGVNAFLPKPIDIKRLLAHIGDLLKIDWMYASGEAGPLLQHGVDEWLEAPPPEEMQRLHRLAQEGSMRDIIRQTEYLEKLDERYRPFAAHLRALAQGYRSKAILNWVEHYIDKGIKSRLSE